MSRAYYSGSISDFLIDSASSVLGEMTLRHEFSLEEAQRDSWIYQIKLLQDILSSIEYGDILFEYTIPRMGKRVDVILLLDGLVFVLEFKVGDSQYSSHALDQALDYALDLKNFHAESYNKKIIPLLVATHAKSIENTISSYEDSVFLPLKANSCNLMDVIGLITSKFLDEKPILAENWVESIYCPTPTIIEAAQALYEGHTVQEISRSESGAVNLTKTSVVISSVIDESRWKRQKAICFVTGVPGSGKTLAGLNIASSRNSTDEGEHAVFLSGNGPLVTVLQEALARNEMVGPIESTEKRTKSSALSRTKVFIQNIHHFRDDSLQTKTAPIEHIAIFDEAQRAWTIEQTASFMNRKKGIRDFGMSEPAFLMSVMDRHNDWSVIICLIGGGQEINTGEAGLPEWFTTINKHFPNWNVYVSDKLTDYEYSRGGNLLTLIDETQLFIKRDLHLSVSIRSYRSEKVSELVKALLDCDLERAADLYSVVKGNYPIVLSRNLNDARKWLKKKSRGSERHGIIASSGAQRLKPFGINIKAKIDPINWFLNEKSDVRSSCYLEDVATEFDIQGLELDWSCVAWDANLRYANSKWEYKCFRGTEWQNIIDDSRVLYLKNAYRVLLTRARQGMVIYIPEGDVDDRTRKSSFYDPTFAYFSDIGFQSI